MFSTTIVKSCFWMIAISVLRLFLTSLNVSHVFLDFVRACHLSQFSRGLNMISCCLVTAPELTFSFGSTRSLSQKHSTEFHDFVSRTLHTLVSNESEFTVHCFYFLSFLVPFFLPFFGAVCCAKCKHINFFTLCWRCIQHFANAQNDIYAIAMETVNNFMCRMKIHFDDYYYYCCSCRNSFRFSSLLSALLSLLAVHFSS